ncbi:hypothetical protein GPJ56_009078 [Histomonas meleagridis]|uniref:uncharacterized protein n=1 Tax=Histomonas meleagridis TaxID=135588 RepID=UPI003559DE64|nr:hypothetical protein GPJ56_009078 [Histomonas meleagridis]KAH0799265.1 hypothetical protein GO595_008062 [Histomonas meleagridis]
MITVKSRGFCIQTQPNCTEVGFVGETNMSNIFVQDARISDISSPSSNCYGIFFDITTTSISTNDWSKVKMPVRINGLVVNNAQQNFNSFSVYTLVETDFRQAFITDVNFTSCNDARDQERLNALGFHFTSISQHVNYLQNVIFSSMKYYFSAPIMYDKAGGFDDSGLVLHNILFDNMIHQNYYEFETFIRRASYISGCSPGVRGYSDETNLKINISNCYFYGDVNISLFSIYVFIVITNQVQYSSYELNFSECVFQHSFDEIILRNDTIIVDEDNKTHPYNLYTRVHYNNLTNTSQEFPSFPLVLPTVNISYSTYSFSSSEPFTASNSLMSQFTEFAIVPSSGFVFTSAVLGVIIGVVSLTVFLFILYMRRDSAVKYFVIGKYNDRDDRFDSEIVPGEDSLSYSPGSYSYSYSYSYKSEKKGKKAAAPKKDNKKEEKKAPPPPKKEEKKDKKPPPKKDNKKPPKKDNKKAKKKDSFSYYSDSYSYSY